MPPLKQANKAAVKDNRTSEEIALQAAMNSHYNLITPMVNAEHVRFTNPLTSKDSHFSTTDPAFFELYYNLSQKGLRKKLDTELKYFADNYNPKWNNVISNIEKYFSEKNLATNEG